jgi:5'-nucleotidase
MEKKIVLFDMDGTGFKYDEKLLRLAHERLGLPLISPEAMEEFHTEKAFPKEYRERVDAIANEEGFFADLEPYEGFVDAFHEISADPRIATFICTSPKKFYKNATCAAEKHLCILKHLGKGVTERIVLARDKTLVHGHVLIDDKPTIEGCATPTWTHIYHDRPYNRSMSGPRITSWKNWREVLEPLLFP